MRRRGVAAATVLVAVLAGCSAEPEPEPMEVDPTPQVLGDVAPAAEGIDLDGVPEALALSEVVRTGWDEQPLERDGVFLGIAAADDPEEPLRLVAVEGDGTVLWEAERPPSCTGFALSRVGDRPVAVLTDLAAADDAFAATTASAYDLVTGDRLWGPVEVPGPHQGPGLVFAAAAPGSALGETGARVALDPATGSTVHAEEERPGTAVVGEYDGVVLVADDDALTGIDASGGEMQWSVPLEDISIHEEGLPTAVPGARVPQSTALVGPGGSDRGTLVDVADGGVLGTGVQDARRDAVTGTLVTLSGSLVTGSTADGVAWTRHVDPQTRLAGAGGVLVYLRVGDGVQVLNASTGQDAVAYAEDATGPLAVPSLFSADGAAVIAFDEHLLVTTRPAAS